MVSGLEIFRRYFQRYNHDYVLIGGVACELALNSRLLEFRPTDDFDIVVVSENAPHGFGGALKEFIRDGGYSVQRRKSNNRPTFFRFLNPVDSDFPSKLELATDKPSDDWQWDFTPVDAGDAKSSLSAILFETDFYRFILENAILVDGISTMRLEGLIPLKCLAWLELSKQENPSAKTLANIAKHRLDIFRLADALESGIFQLPATVATKTNDALSQMRTSGLTEDEQNYFEMIRSFYQLV